MVFKCSSRIYGIILSLISVPACAMDQPAYLVHPEHYEKFRLTRPYGKLKLDDLPEDIVHNHIRPHLARWAAIKLQHRFLRYNFFSHIHYGTSSWQIKELERSHYLREKIFQYHDGRYAIVPDLKCNYTMWDNPHRCIYKTKIEGDECRKRFISRNQQGTEIYISYSQKKIYIKSPEKTIHFSSKHKLTHYALGNDDRFAFCKKGSRLVKLQDITSEAYQLAYLNGNAVMALCAAHKLPYFAACNEREIRLFTDHWMFPFPNPLRKSLDGHPVHMQFSPDDTQLLIYHNRGICLYDIKDVIGPRKKSTVLVNRMGLCNGDVSQNMPIQKASFSPDSKKIIVTLKNGQFRLYKDGADIRGAYCVHCSMKEWDENAAYTKTYPLMLWGDRNKLLFLFNPDFCDILKFRIYKSANGGFLAGYDFGLNYPIAMGITQDERTIIFKDKNGTISKLDLFNSIDLDDIDFVEKRANWYQLYSLLQTCKSIRTNQQSFAPFGISHIRSQIAEYQSKFKNMKS